MSKFQAHKDAPDEVWLQIGYGDEGEHTWAPHEIGEDGIEEAGPYVRADRLSGRVTVSVKPLEWDEITEQRSAEEPIHEHTGDYEAITPIGNYYIEMYFGSDSYGWEVRLDSVGKVADCDDPDTAKAAAQADHESRILAALDAAPATGRPAIASSPDIQMGLLLQVNAATRAIDDIQGIITEATEQGDGQEDTPDRVLLRIRQCRSELMEAQRGVVSDQCIDAYHKRHPETAPASHLIRSGERR